MDHIFFLLFWNILVVFVAVFSGEEDLAFGDFSPRPQTLVFFSKYMDNLEPATWFLFYFLYESCKGFDTV